MVEVEMILMNEKNWSDEYWRIGWLICRQVDWYAVNRRLQPILSIYISILCSRQITIMCVRGCFLAVSTKDAFKFTSESFTSKTQRRTSKQCINRISKFGSHRLQVVSLLIRWECRRRSLILYKQQTYWVWCHSELTYCLFT